MSTATFTGPSEEISFLGDGNSFIVIPDALRLSDFAADVIASAPHLQLQATGTNSSKPSISGTFSIRGGFFLDIRGVIITGVPGGFSPLIYAPDTASNASEPYARAPLTAAASAATCYTTAPATTLEVTGMLGYGTLVAPQTSFLLSNATADDFLATGVLFIPATATGVSHVDFSIAATAITPITCPAFVHSKGKQAAFTAN